ncbi:hypothetical protein HRbin12_01218 [bacterium HR12]|nr:hypothetical protein HRbin12_01218 [bacterium HR12]
MRRVIVTALVLCTTSWGLVGGQGHRMTRLDDSRPIASRSASRGPCDEERYRMRPAMGRQEVGRRVRALIRCAVERWDVPGGADKAIAVARCESGFWPWANGDGNLGVFQHRDRYWQDRVRRLLRERWFSRRQWERIDRDATVHPGAAYLARANVLVAVRMAHASGWGAWSCA